MQDMSLLNHFNPSAGVAGKVVEDFGAPLYGVFCWHITGELIGVGMWDSCQGGMK